MENINAFYKAIEFVEELNNLIDEENLNHDKTVQFMKNSFHNGYINKVGTDIKELMAPISYFNPERELVKERITNKLEALFNKYQKYNKTKNN